MYLRIVRLILVSFLFSFIGCSMSGGGDSDGKRLLSSKPEVVSIETLDPVEWSLPNGLTVLFLADRELPMVGGTLYLPGGYIYDSKDEVGLSGAMGDLMRDGGAGDLNADQLDEALEKLSASIGSSFDKEYGSVGFFSLSSDFDEVFTLFSDVVRRPRFDSNRVKVWKGQTSESLRRRKEDPGTIATISFNQLVYGGSPYGRVLTEKNLQEINRVELLRSHRYYVRPDQALLVVSGDLSVDKLKKAVTRCFGDWKKRGSSLPSPPKVSEKDTSAGIYFVEQPFSQSTFVMGHLGVPRHTEDEYAIRVFNEIFGAGGFSSKLNERIRIELGLAYGTYGAISPGVVQGKNGIFVQTKAESTVQAMGESLNVLKFMQNKLVADEDLERVRDGVRNSFVFKFDSPKKMVSRRATLRLLGYPDSYDDDYIERIVSVSPEEIRKVARKRWDIGKFVVVVVGNKKAYSSLKESLGSESDDTLAPIKGLPVKKLKFNQRLLGLQN